MNNKTVREMRDKDQFFTKQDVSKKCIQVTKEYIDLIENSLGPLFLVEPSAGNGDFFYNFPKETRLAFDIDKPKNIVDASYIETNFLDIKIAKNVVYIGNPPFGKSGKLAFDFIMKCIDLEASIIAFILPPNINTKARLKLIKKHGYDIVHSEQLPTSSFYFYNGVEVKDMPAEAIFQIYIKKDYIDLYNIKTLSSINLKNNDIVQVYTINTNVLKNVNRDVDGVPFIQDGVGRDWVGKCDFYLPLRVFESKGLPSYSDNFEDPNISNIGFGVICVDKNIKNKMIIENCYTIGMNKIRIAKKQLILKEIMRTISIEKGD